MEVHRLLKQGEQKIGRPPRGRVSSVGPKRRTSPVQCTLEGETSTGLTSPERTYIYQAVALKALRPLLRFFKYRQAHGRLRDATAADMSSLYGLMKQGKSFRVRLVFPTCWSCPESSWTETWG